MRKFVWLPEDLQPMVACETCKHKHDGPTCEAFPQGIPEDILAGRNQHRDRYPGDGGTIWEARGA